MTLTDFIKKYTNQPVDFDGIYPNQCFDLVHRYIYDVLGITYKGVISHPAAYQIYTEFNQNGFDAQHFERVENTPAGVPQPGDILVWGQAVGAYGHTAIFVSGNANAFASFDANWPVGTLPHLQGHSYDGVLGWLHPKGAVITQPTSQEPIITDQTIIDFGGEIGVQEVGAMRSMYLDMKRNYEGAMIQAQDLGKQLNQCLKTASTSPVQPPFSGNPTCDTPQTGCNAPKTAGILFQHSFANLLLTVEKLDS